MITTTITKDNYPEVSRIYLEGIKTGLATFETSAPEWADWDQAHLPYARIAAVSTEGTMRGWASLSPVSSRCVYGGVAEVSVYVSETARGHGLGQSLLTQLIEESEQHGIWTLQSGIFRDNIGSMKIHEKCGFRIIGYKERIGQLNGRWMDNILMERRSMKVGI